MTAAIQRETAYLASDRTHLPDRRARRDANRRRHLLGTVVLALAVLACLGAQQLTAQALTSQFQGIWQADTMSDERRWKEAADIV